MNKFKIKVIVVLLLIGSILTGCQREGSIVFSEERNSFWLRDIEYIEKILPSVHDNFYAHITKEEFTSQIEKLKGDVPHINDEEIKIRLMEIFVQVKDAHLFIVNFYSDMQKIFSVETFLNVSLSNNMTSLIPIKTRWFGDSLYVTDIDSEYKQALGTKLIKINNVPIEDVMNNINKMIPHNNEQRLRFLNPMHLVHPQILRHFDVIKKDMGIFTFEDKDGKTFKLKIKEKSIDEVNFISVLDSAKKSPLYMKKDDLFWYEYIPEENSLYFRLSTYGNTTIPDEIRYEDKGKAHSFVPPQSFSKFSQFTQEMISVLKDNNVEKFIIDLRNNNGGYSNITNDLFYYVLNNAKTYERGKLFIIADRGSFSAPIIDCMRFRQGTDAIIIGEPTGEMPFLMHGARANMLTLPSSKLTILYTVEEFIPVDEKMDSIIPDYIVDQSFEDYKNGIDTVMEAILDYENK